MFKDIIIAGYNRVAQAYLSDRQNLRTGKYLQKFMSLLPAQATVLDLGCGAGLPVAASLIKKGYLVTGFDISPQQIALARKYCPRGDFQVQDIEQLDFQAYQVDAVVCVYTLFHLPRTQHLMMLKKIASFLQTGGLALITMGDCDFEGVHDFYGVKMWSSQYGPSQNLQLFKQAGFTVLLNEINNSGREKHQILMGRKI